jgi:hypothetical protein
VNFLAVRARDLMESLLSFISGQSMESILILITSLIILGQDLGPLIVKVSPSYTEIILEGLADPKVFSLAKVGKMRKQSMEIFKNFINSLRVDWVVYL